MMALLFSVLTQAMASIRAPQASLMETQSTSGMTMDASSFAGSSMVARLAAPAFIRQKEAFNDVQAVQQNLLQMENHLKGDVDTFEERMRTGNFPAPGPMSLLQTGESPEQADINQTGAYVLTAADPPPVPPEQADINKIDPTLVGIEDDLEKFNAHLKSEINTAQQAADAHALPNHQLSQPSSFLETDHVLPVDEVNPGDPTIWNQADQDHATSFLEEAMATARDVVKEVYGASATPSRMDIEELSREVLKELGVPEDEIGIAMAQLEARAGVVTSHTETNFMHDQIASSLLQATAHEDATDNELKEKRQAEIAKLAKLQSDTAAPSSFVEEGAPDSFADLDAKLKALEEKTKAELAKLQSDTAAPSSFAEEGKPDHTFKDRMNQLRQKMTKAEISAEDHVPEVSMDVLDAPTEDELDGILHPKVRTRDFQKNEDMEMKRMRKKAQAVEEKEKLKGDIYDERSDDVLDHMTERAAAMDAKTKEFASEVTSEEDAKEKEFASEAATKFPGSYIETGSNLPEWHEASSTKEWDDGKVTPKMQEQQINGLIERIHHQSAEIRDEAKKEAPAQTGSFLEDSPAAPEKNSDDVAPDVTAEDDKLHTLLSNIKSTAAMFHTTTAVAGEQASLLEQDPEDDTKDDDGAPMDLAHRELDASGPRLLDLDRGFKEQISKYSDELQQDSDSSLLQTGQRAPDSGFMDQLKAIEAEHSPDHSASLAADHFDLPEYSVAPPAFASLEVPAQLESPSSMVEKGSVDVDSNGRISNMRKEAQK